MSTFDVEKEMEAIRLDMIYWKEGYRTGTQFASMKDDAVTSLGSTFLSAHQRQDVISASQALHMTIGLLEGVVRTRRLAELYKVDTYPY